MLRAAVRLVAGTASLATGGWVLRALNDAPASLGAGRGAIRPVADRSPHYRDGVFHNLEPASALRLDAEENRLVLFDMLSSRSASRPRAAVPLADPPAPAGSEPLAVSWLGHSTALLEIDGYRVLTDPIWSERCSPSRTAGPQRLHPVPAPLESLTALDAVVVSHDHYDHLDMDTVLALARTQRAPFLVPLGVGAHLRQWGIPEDRIVELDWNEEHRIGELTLVCTPARHFSGRFLSRNTTLWSSWAIVGPRHRAYFGGDTGYTRSFAEIGADHGPFDLTLLPIGAYHTAWPDIHMNPEEAVQAHRDVTDAGLLVPIHWCTFRLAPHPWAEPVERLLAAADGAGVNVAVPKPGSRVVTGSSPAIEPWWQL
ncbi:MBL fold metallo-hydrolase [Candidatus Mycolicibacterium alkanivorans]|uniref:MBL fold metallo-hydrolase n=1 Tax=Candidatus Mycolicibacterium alkanivorans TaxID=2954114 RepID=A0ABS9YTW7_9MYCO|nr:MBL fold metallo-hydrolase [Candidatus Mycolicibacterium alkanivorans]MCI4674646.1 MBL fold metallo-hydrolase [Candidatus Mycolicibacterium alkanivorans]